LEYLQNTIPEVKRESFRWLLLDLIDLESVTVAVDGLKGRESKVDLWSTCHNVTNMPSMF
jgi:hypothetical protein